MGVRAPRSRGSRVRGVAAGLVAAIVAAAGVASVPPAGGATKLDKVTIGYSAWPGWFPLAVADQAGIFEENGLDVELEYFSDYIASLDAMAAGKLDANTQTLNDTMAAVAGGSKQTIIVVNDNSAGNDAIICDESITSVADMKGKTVAAEQGVVDHFLLLQGLTEAGMSEDDIDFRGVLTADAAASFADGEFDCVGVFAPFTLDALKRPGSHVVFSSADFPGIIPDHIVVKRDLASKRPKVAQKIVNAWYETLDHLEANPEESVEIMADVGDFTTEEYQEFAGGTRLFSVDEALTAFQPGNDTTSLEYTAKLINPFMVKSGLTEKPARLKGLFAPRFTQAYADANAATTS